MGQAAIQPVNPPATLRSARAAPGASRRPRMGGKRRADASPRSRERGEGGWRGVEIGLGLRLRLRWKKCLKEKLMSWSCNKLDFCFFWDDFGGRYHLNYNSQICKQVTSAHMSIPLHHLSIQPTPTYTNPPTSCNPFNRCDDQERASDDSITEWVRSWRQYLYEKTKVLSL